MQGRNAQFQNEASEAQNLRHLLHQADQHAYSIRRQAEEDRERARRIEDEVQQQAHAAMYQAECDRTEKG